MPSRLKTILPDEISLPVGVFWPAWSSGIIAPLGSQGQVPIILRCYAEGPMGMYRVFAGNDGESHIEELRLADHPELGVMTNISEVKVQEFDGTRDMPLHPLPERRLIIHLSGEVEITTSDGSKQVFRAGDIRLMEDVTGRGHAHVDLSPSEAVYIILKD